MPEKKKKKNLCNILAKNALPEFNHKKQQEKKKRGIFNRKKRLLCYLKRSMI